MDIQVSLKNMNALSTHVYFVIANKLQIVVKLLELNLLDDIQFVR